MSKYHGSKNIIPPSEKNRLHKYVWIGETTSRRLLRETRSSHNLCMLMRLVLRLESLLQNLKASAKLEVKTLFSRTRKIMALWKRRPLSRLDQQPYTTKLHRIRALPTNTGLAKITTSLLRNISTMAIFLQMASHEWNDKFLLTQSPLIWKLLNVPDEK